MSRIKNAIELLKVVINNFIPIARELSNSRISKLKHRIINFQFQKIFVGSPLLICLSMLLLFSVDFSNQQKDFNADTGQKIFSYEERDIGIADDLSVVLLMYDVDLKKQEEQVAVLDKKVIKQKEKKKIRNDYWREFFIMDDKLFGPEEIEWKEELSQMRYKCNSNWNKRVDVACRGRDYFCTVSFEIVLDDKKYKLIFRSDVSINGLDRISKMKVYVWSKGKERVDEIRRSSIVDRIIKAKPKCTPFSSD